MEQEKTFERMKIIITQIGDCLGQEIDRDNPDEVLGKLQELASIQSTASYCLATAKQLHNSKIAQLLVSELYKGYTATDRKLIFLEVAKEEMFYLNLIDRYVANISHSIESLRSILSFKKHEIDQSRYQTT
ncbi:Uncharacterised protein [Sphingobacterium spiritivorum]|uniref:Four helix bundle protein n=1 Tax=Sphingobacterium spiritivorum TaxID=258 RepID=A0A380CG06_SPHSI|nr:hypothetical protein [Sphingobacterium spiritivorum]SUJ18724.1 Uncharacterised protein [Sphingobacterium spiritivorum]